MQKKFNFTPPEVFENSSSYPNPQNERETREQLSRPLNQIKDYINNEVTTEIKKPISSDNSVDIVEQEQDFDLSVARYVKEENGKVVAKVENLIVTTTANPLSPQQFICDYTSDEIRNALIQNKTVVMHFEDTIEKSGSQVYPFLKMTEDGAYFRRCQATEEYVRQIDIKVDYAKNVTFKETRYVAQDKQNFATIKADNIAEITNVETFRSYFYNLRKSQSRKWQFEVSQGNENIIQGIGGLPNGVSTSDKCFIYVEIPYSEAGGFEIDITYQGRTNGKMYHKIMFATLDANWHEIDWYSIKDYATKTDLTNATKDQINEITSDDGSIKIVKSGNSVDLKVLSGGGGSGVSKEYVDEQDAKNLANAKSFAQSEDATNLANAKSYTDSEIGKTNTQVSNNTTAISKKVDKSTYDAKMKLLDEMNVFQNNQLEKNATAIETKADKTQLGEQVTYEFDEAKGELNIIAKV